MVASEGSGLLHERAQLLPERLKPHEISINPIITDSRSFRRPIRGRFARTHATPNPARERHPRRAAIDLGRMPQLPCAEWEGRNPRDRSGDSFKNGGHTRPFRDVTVESHALDA